MYILFHCIPRKGDFLLLKVSHEYIGLLMLFSILSCLKSPIIKITNKPKS